MNKFSNRLIAIYIGLDLGFGPLLAFSALKILAVQPAADAAWILAAFIAPKILIFYPYISKSLRATDAYDRASGTEKDRLLVAADEQLQRFASAFSIFYCVTWVLALGGAFAVILMKSPGHFVLLPEATLAMLFLLVATLFGGFAVVYPLALLLTAAPSGQCAVHARKVGVRLLREPSRLQTRIGIVALALALAPTLWMSAVGYMAQAEAALTPAGEAAEAGNDKHLGFLLSAGTFAMIMVLWAPMTSLALSRAVSGPLERLARAAREVVEEGNQTTIGVLPVTRSDEVGLLADRFNDLMDMMRDLSVGAQAIASGNLDIQIERRGELPDAFQRMAESLREIVTQILQTSVELAAAATEILAASQEQESAAASQSTAMTEISRTMDSLSESAAHVSEAVAGVLNNAEQTLETTDSMVERIEGLSSHTGRISDLLDAIRDIADKSDLLALNGSLEASRAGEGGQGFALVAAEMRRLAVRVTASVEDVKSLIADIRESSSTTIMATEQSRRLARETTEAARQITFVSQQQRTGTDQVTQSVREAASVVSQSAAATSQTRTSAQGLKQQADLLSNLVRAFQFKAKQG